MGCTASSGSTAAANCFGHLHQRICLLDRKDTYILNQNEGMILPSLQALKLERLNCSPLPSTLDVVMAPATSNSSQGATCNREPPLSTISSLTVADTGFMMLSKLSISSMSLDEVGTLPLPCLHHQPGCYKRLSAAAPFGLSFFWT